MCTEVTCFPYPVLRGPVWGGGAEKGAGAWALGNKRKEGNVPAHREPRRSLFWRGWWREVVSEIFKSESGTVGFIFQTRNRQATQWVDGSEERPGAWGPVADILVRNNEVLKTGQ